MTSWVVSDSGIFIATVIKEPLSSKADALLEHWKQQDVQVHAPRLFQYEVIAVLRKHVHRTTLTPQEGVRSRDWLLAQPIMLWINKDLLRRAYDLATQLNLPTAYDAQYLALAEYLKGDFWTMDERLFNIVHQQLSWVKWLGNFTPPAGSP